MHDSVTVHMKAAPEDIWALISDVRRTGEFSPETFEAEWVGGATGPAIGARFRGHVNRNNKGLKYWTDCVVTDSVPGEVFAFDVVAGGRTVNSWRYELAPAGDGTDVTESFALAKNPFTQAYWLLLGWARGRTNREGMRTTLHRIRAVAETVTRSA